MGGGYRMLDKLSDADFSSNIGTEFNVAWGEGRQYVLRLISVTTGDQGSTPESRRPFSLQFHGSPDVILPQSIYQLESAALGPLAIFLVPIGRDAAAVIYEAIFT